MKLFHKSVEKRVNVFLKGMEIVWAENFAFKDEMAALGTKYKPAMEHVSSFAEYVDTAKQDVYILPLTKNLLQQQCDKLTKMFMDNTPLFMELVTKVIPKIDETIGYLDKVTKTLQKLSDNRNSVEYSERVMAKFEESLAKYQKQNTIIRKRLDAISAGFEEMEKYYQSLKSSPDR